MSNQPITPKHVQEYIAAVQSVQSETIKITPEMQKLADEIRRKRGSGI